MSHGPFGLGGGTLDFASAGVAIVNEAPISVSAIAVAAALPRIRMGDLNMSDSNLHFAGLSARSRAGPP